MRYATWRSTILFSLLLWGMLLLRMGYRFGTDDQIELLPYLLKLHNPSLYESDFFMQSLCGSQYNERWAVAHLLLPFADILEPVCFLLHAVVSLFLFSGLQQFLSQAFGNVYEVRIGLLLSFIFFPDVVVGADELYYNLFQGSMLADAVLVWGLYYMLKRSFVIAAVCFSAATLFHPMEGWVLFAAVAIPLTMRSADDGNAKQVIQHFLAPYLLFSAMLFIALWQQRSGGDATRFNQVFIQWRHPHHYFAAYTPLRHLAYMVLFAAALLLMAKHRSSFLFRFACMLVLLMIGYVLFSILFPQSSLLLFQVLKLSKWLKPAGVVAIVALVFFVSGKLTHLNQHSHRLLYAATLAGMFAYVLFRTDNVFGSMQWHLGEQKLQYADIDVSVMAKELTSETAVFCTPPMLTAFKFYSQRSSFVDFKANPKQPRYTAEWVNRLQQVYGLHLSLPEKGFELVRVAERNYNSLTPSDMVRLRECGVSHLVVDAGVIIDGTHRLYQNDRYAILAL